VLGYAKLLVALALVVVAVWMWLTRKRRGFQLGSVVAAFSLPLLALLPAYAGVKALRHEAFLAALRKGPPAGLTDFDIGWFFAATPSQWKAWEAMSDVDKANIRCPDLRGFDAARFSSPLKVSSAYTRTEDWEFSFGDRTATRDTLGYATVVKNVYGQKADGKYYLFYAQHDPPSGIGCAVADTPEGPFRKLKEIDPSRTDSRVLIPTESFAKKLSRTSTAHYSSPCAVWNAEEKRWFLYFHFYRNQFVEGRGHQKTALATCDDLAAAKWTPVTDSDGELVPVLPNTVERWMNSQSSYHAIQRLPNGIWLACLRGTGGEYTSAGEWKQDVTKIGFAVSRDGRKWQLLPDQPAIYAGGPNGRRDGCYRPWFVLPLAPDRFGVCWGESEFYDKNFSFAWGATSDFKTFKRDDNPAFKWHGEDGPACVWREGDRLWIFGGKKVSEFGVSQSVSE
jgi:hypothetical protein